MGALIRDFPSARPCNDKMPTIARRNIWKLEKILPLRKHKNLTIEKMERLLHYVWKHKLYMPGTLVTAGNIPVNVIDPGIQNTDAGPDFFNAKINIGEKTWAGNVEIHEKASDWMRHHHDKDNAYDSVILHLVGLDDAAVYRTTGEIIPQALLTVPGQVKENIDWLLSRDTSIPCLPRLREIESITASSWVSALLVERLERKTNDIQLLLEQYNNDWNEVFYITLARAFGFGLNSEAFERLAKSLPYHCILKQRYSHSQIESMLFGQAGMLSEVIHTYFYRFLQEEYKFFRHKFNLQPLDASIFKNLRTRPMNFPHVKIAQLASILVEYDTLFSRILAEENPAEIKKLFRLPPSEYWETHYHFRDAQHTPTKKVMGDGALNILFINAVVPILFAYGQKNKQMEYCERAMDLLESLPPEMNQIVIAFKNNGISVKHAGDSQALIQLKREYCEKKKCLYCRIGFRLLKRSCPR
jgi:hypothetical protein